VRCPVWCGAAVAEPVLGDARAVGTTGADAVGIKFCGLTRAADAAMAAELGASYAGVIFAGGPRLLDVARAREVFAPLAGTAVRRAGIFGGQQPHEILRIADEAALDVLQLHGGATVALTLSLREGFHGAIWHVLKVDDSTIPPVDDSVLAQVDAVVLDTAVGGRSGGTGVAFDWAGTREAVRALSRRRPVVLAGGLRPENVAEAVRLLAPQVVDVSSGVESAPGIKDHARMRAFAAGARRKG